MFFIIIKKAFLNLSKDKYSQLLNILSLVIGFSCFIIISIWTYNELSFDKHFINSEKIYRVEYDGWITTTSALANDFYNFYPEVEKVTRLKYWNDVLIKYKNEKSSIIENFQFVDSTFFTLFDFKFIHGAQQNALTNPFEVIITKKLNDKLYNGENSVGKTFKVNHNEYTIKGVIETPEKFHIKVDAMASFISLGKIYSPEFINNHKSWQFPTYILLKENIDISSLENKIADEYEKQYPEQEYRPNVYLRPLKEAHYTNKDVISFIHTNKKVIYSYLALGIFILLIALINYVNLTTAHSFTRAKEIAIKKLHGSKKSQVVFQFIAESAFINIISITLSIIFITFLMPFINSLLITKVDLAILFSLKGILFITCSIIVVSFLAGIYPALNAFAFNTLKVLKNLYLGAKGSAKFRKTLTVLQFSIASFLIVTSIGIYNQLEFLKNKDLGFDIDNKVLIKMYKGLDKEQFKNELLNYPEILNVTFVSQKPGRITNICSWNVGDQTYYLKELLADPDFFQTYDLSIISGRGFSNDITTDIQKSLIVNEVAANEIKNGSIIGQKIKSYLGEGEIIGVVKDFHYNSLHNPIEPLFICWHPQRTKWAVIHTQDNNKALSIINDVWEKFLPGSELKYSFQDDAFFNQYNKEKNTKTLYLVLAGIAIFISALGIFGLTNFLTEIRKKEIGIRKVLGSSSQYIIFLFFKDYIIYILIACCISWPLAYMYLYNWLSNFAYQTAIHPVGIFLSLLAMLTVTCITVGYLVYKTARKNPIESLRYE